MIKKELTKEQIEKKLSKIESELDNCRTSSFIDGWQTQKHAKRSRKWDFLAQEKFELQKQLNEL
jgi:predicted  nucleic acid-binding Zn-ribbon protein